jgi:hypothetical protein
MGADSVSRFFDAVRSDKRLAEEYGAAVARATHEAVGKAAEEVAASHGFEVDAADALRFLEERAAELSDDQLDAVAGGIGLPKAVKVEPSKPTRGWWVPAALGAVVVVGAAMDTGGDDDDREGIAP